jgi:hypothetical protein
MVWSYKAFITKFLSLITKMLIRCHWSDGLYLGWMVISGFGSVCVCGGRLSDGQGVPRWVSHWKRHSGIGRLSELVLKVE